DEALRETDGRDSPVVMIEEMYDSSLFRRLVHLLRLGVVEGDRFFAEDVLTGLDSLQGDLMMEVGRGADIDDIDIVAPDGLLPVRLASLPTPSIRELLQRPRLAATDHFERRLGLHIEKVRRLLPGIAVGLAHEIVADDRDIEFIHDNASISLRPSLCA